jgi:hypothetical protein
MSTLSSSDALFHDAMLSASFIGASIIETACHSGEEYINSNAASLVDGINVSNHATPIGSITPAPHFHALVTVFHHLLTKSLILLSILLGLILPVFCNNLPNFLNHHLVFSSVILSNSYLFLGTLFHFTLRAFHLSKNASSVSLCMWYSLIFSGNHCHGYSSSSLAEIVSLILSLSLLFTLVLGEVTSSLVCAYLISFQISLFLSCSSNKLNSSSLA